MESEIMVHTHRKYFQLKNKKNKHEGEWKCIKMRGHIRILEYLELKLHYPGGPFPSFSPLATAPVLMDCVTRWGYEELEERKCGSDSIQEGDLGAKKPIIYCGTVKQQNHTIKYEGSRKKAKMWQEKNFGRNHLDNIAMYETDVRILDKGFSLSYHPPPN